MIPPVYHTVAKTWVNQINQSPILLTNNDIRNWRSYRTNKLKTHQIYLWHATKFDWIPVWTTEKGFLLMNLDIMKYENVNYNNFTNANTRN